VRPTSAHHGRDRDRPRRRGQTDKRWRGQADGRHGSAGTRLPVLASKRPVFAGERRYGQAETRRSVYAGKRRRGQADKRSRGHAGDRKESPDRGRNQTGLFGDRVGPRHLVDDDAAIR
jgi:hypothetical protein